MMGYSWNGLIMFHLNVMKHVFIGALPLKEKIDLGWVFLVKPNFKNDMYHYMMKGKGNTHTSVNRLYGLSSIGVVHQVRLS